MFIFCWRLLCHIYLRKLFVSFAFSKLLVLKFIFLRKFLRRKLFQVMHLKQFNKYLTRTILCYLIKFIINNSLKVQIYLKNLLTFEIKIFILEISKCFQFLYNCSYSHKFAVNNNNKHFISNFR